MESKNLTAVEVCPIMKGNNGVSAKKRRMKHLQLWFGILGLILLPIFGVVVYNNKQINISNTETSSHRQKEKLYIAQSKTNARTSTAKQSSTIEDILEGRLTLIDIHVQSKGLTEQAASSSIGNNNNDRYKVIGYFCYIDWSYQRDDVSKVAMFRDLKTKSGETLCQQTMISVDLYDITQQAKQYDDKNSAEDKHSTSFLSKPSGVVFHETRCGSTLFANLLTGFVGLQKTTKDSDEEQQQQQQLQPHNSRVFSESPPPLAALRACGSTSDDTNNNCDPELHTTLIRDVFYMMGRKRLDDTTSEEQQYVFYKIQSIGSFSIDKFTMAFPDVPWVFVYRDTVEIMQSHLKNVITSADIQSKTKTKTKKSTHLPVCARNFRLSYNQQPQTTKEIIDRNQKQQNNSGTMDELSIIEYCAAHLGGLSLSAIQAYEKQNKRQINSSNNKYSYGRFVNYVDMPQIVWEDILPNHFLSVGNDRGSDANNNNNNKSEPGVLSKQSIMNMKQISNVYSKQGRGKKENQQWKDDTQHKQSTATKDVTMAAELFTTYTYNRMTELS